jgi:hypothetical protein
MSLQVLLHTPGWVWLVLALLIWRGCKLMQPRQVPLTRIAMLPAIFLLLSLCGLVSSFGVRADALLCWSAGMVLAAYETQRRGPPTGATYLPATRSFHLPGSGLPLALMLSIFTVKYLVAVQIALHPALRHETLFADACSAAFGAFSGVFLGRALRMRSLYLLPAGAGSVAIPGA